MDTHFIIRSIHYTVPGKYNQPFRSVLETSVNNMNKQGLDVNTALHNLPEKVSNLRYSVHVKHG